MIEYNLHHVNGIFFEIKSDGGKNLDYNVSFTDNTKGKIVYETTLKHSNRTNKFGFEYCRNLYGN